jgi:hypothetical protein
MELATQSFVAAYTAVIRVYDEGGNVIALISADSPQSGLLRRWLEKDPADSRQIFQGELLLLQSSEQGAFGSACRAPRRDCFRHNQGQ